MNIDIEKLVQHLDFDTSIYGFKVAKILQSTPAKACGYILLEDILQYLKSQEVRLVIWAVASDDIESNDAARHAGGFLGVAQVTYLIDLKHCDRVRTIATDVEIYAEKTANHELEELAIAAGSLSHYRIDKNLPQNLVDDFYKKWIANSCNGSIAKKVFVIQRNGKIAAMITLGEKNHRCDIGLLGVNEKYRGQKLGQTLVYAAQKYFINSGFDRLQVVTQKNNIPACHLYEKCGFKKEKIENYYHFWL